MFHVSVESNSLASSIGQELRNGSSQSAPSGFLSTLPVSFQKETKKTSYLMPLLFFCQTRVLS